MPVVLYECNQLLFSITKYVFCVSALLKHLPCYEKNISEKSCDDKCGNVDAVTNAVEAKLNSTDWIDFESIKKLMDSMGPLCK